MCLFLSEVLCLSCINKVRPGELVFHCDCSFSYDSRESNREKEKHDEWGRTYGGQTEREGERVGPPLSSLCSWEETLTGSHALREATKRMNRSLTTLADKSSNPVDVKALVSNFGNTSRLIATRRTTTTLCPYSRSKEQRGRITDKPLKVRTRPFTGWVTDVQ